VPGLLDDHEVRAEAEQRLGPAGQFGADAAVAGAVQVQRRLRRHPAGRGLLARIGPAARRRLTSGRAVIAQRGGEPARPAQALLARSGSS